MDKKALFFDIDGTLVSFNTHSIPASTTQAIAAARAEGHKIFIATGRPPAIINNLGDLQERGLIDGYVTMNGAYCFAGEEVLYKNPIPHADVVRMAEFCRERGYACIFVRERSMAVYQKNDEVKRVFGTMLHVPGIPDTDFEEAVSGEVYQMTPFFGSDAEEDARALLPGCEFGRWYPSFVDITAPGTTKAHGVESVMKHYGMSMADAVTFGDGGNDIPMLRAAGTGVAMGNAGEEVKASADMVTKSVDDGGIAYALLRLGLTGPKQEENEIVI